MAIRISAWAEFEGKDYEEEIELDPEQEEEYKSLAAKDRFAFLSAIVREWALERFSYGLDQVDDSGKVTKLNELWDSQEGRG